MQDFEIPFDKSKALIAVILGIAIALFGVWLFQGQDTIELPYKYQLFFRSTLNAALFMIVTGVGFSLFGIRRFLKSQAGIVLNADGFMDHRYLNAPIPWANIVNYDTRFETIWNNDVEVLLLQLRPGTKDNVSFNLNYKINTFIKSSHSEVVAFALNGMEDQDSYDFKQAFSRWIMNGRIAHATVGAYPRGSASPQGFGRRGV